MLHRTRILIGLVILAISALTLVSCGGGDSAYVGKWELDKEAFKKAVEAEMKKEENSEDGMDAFAAGMMAGMIESMQMEVDIKSDHTFTAKMSMAMMGEDTTTGTWKREGDGIIMTSSDGESPGKLVLKGGKLHAQSEDNSEEPPIVLKKKTS